jgi:Zn-dependent protease
MAGSPAFHLFGFPIHVRPGFVMFMVLVVVVNGGELGLWIAGSAAVLTLVHELGHAFAARATGARAEIALDFLAGYASFVPTRPLKRWERAGISVAGPAIQIGVGVAVLLLIGVNPIDRSSVATSEAAIAIWWTGPVMGLFNLAPVLPLDGGHIVAAGLDRLLPGRSRPVMLWFSIVVTGLAAVVLMLDPDTQSLGVFVLFPLLVQLQMLSASRPRPVTSRSRLAQAEADAWRADDLSRMPEGRVPSPWYRADQQLRQGDPDVARRLLVADFAEPTPPDWWPPDVAPAERLAAVVDLLPRPLPTGRLYSEHALAHVLLRVGRFEEAAHYASASFARHRTTSMAAVVARAAAALDDRETAFGWLEAAIEADTDLDGLVHTIDHAPEFAPLRHEARWVELRRRLDG